MVAGDHLRLIIFIQQSGPDAFQIIRMSDDKGGGLRFGSKYLYQGFALIVAQEHEGQGQGRGRAFGQVIEYFPADQALQAAGR